MNIDPLEAVVWYVVFVFSTTLHEAAHALTAKLGGDPTAYHGGQVSMDPYPHMRREPLGMVGLPVISLLVSGWPIGFASAPYDPMWAERYPRRAGWMALAGPMANLSLVLVAAVVIRIGMMAGVFEAPFGRRTIELTGIVLSSKSPFWQNMAMFVSMLFSLNMLLGMLNLIPLPPLDGSAAMPLILGGRAAARYREFARQPGLAIFGLIIAWHLLNVIFWPVMKAAIRLLYWGAM